MLNDERDRAQFSKDLEELDLMVKSALQTVKDTEIHENIEPVDVMELLDQLKNGVALQGKVLAIRGHALPIRAKALALKRCLMNLVDNAVMYGEQAEVMIEDNEHELVLRICDRGPGIPADRLETVFEPYVRLEPSRNRNTGGTGLGLGIARNIVLSHGGSLTLVNRTLGGLEARLVLPRN
jgi:signal transduction histidine kinase